jgi:hypothetical protein
MFKGLQVLVIDVHDQVPSLVTCSTEQDEVFGQYSGPQVSWIRRGIGGRSFHAGLTTLI